MPVPKLTEMYNVKLLTAGWSTRTNRFYPKRAFQNIQKQFEPPSLGDFHFTGDNDSFLRLDLTKVSHRTTRIYLKNDDTELWAEVHLLDTVCGRIVRDLHEAKLVRFDCALLGTLNEYDEVVADSVQFLRVTAYGSHK